MEHLIVERLRQHHRFISDQAKVLPHRYLGTALNLLETRILHELNYQDRHTAKSLVRTLDIDKGALSRVLRRFEDKGWIARDRTQGPRLQTMSLTDAGRALIMGVREKTNTYVAQMLGALTDDENEQLLQALETVERLTSRDAAFRIRVYSEDDLYAVVDVQDRIYREEFGWNDDYAVMARGMLEMWTPDHWRETGWIVEHQGLVVGGMFLFDAGGGVAQIRQFFLDDTARGHGLGRALVGRFVAHARLAGYARMRLWTQESLKGARKIYAEFGFEPVSTRPHTMFGVELVEEIWERDL